MNRREEEKAHKNFFTTKRIGEEEAHKGVKGVLLQN